VHGSPSLNYIDGLVDYVRRHREALHGARHFHAELRRTGYVTDELEYRSYSQLWSKLSSR